MPRKNKRKKSGNKFGTTVKPYYVERGVDVYGVFKNELTNLRATTGRKSNYYSISTGFFSFGVGLSVQAVFSLPMSTDKWAVWVLGGLISIVCGIFYRKQGNDEKESEDEIIKDIKRNSKSREV